jgi:hypothetical protein
VRSSSVSSASLVRSASSRLQAVSVSWTRAAGARAAPRVRQRAREVVFFFEGENAAGAVDALAQSPNVLQAAVRWRRILGGRPRLAAERFAWARPA